MDKNRNVSNIHYGVVSEALESLTVKRGTCSTCVLVLEHRASFFSTSG
jgi:hypothetical protein